LEFSEAKEKLRQGYVNYGFELVDENEGKKKARD